MVSAFLSALCRKRGSDEYCITSPLYSDVTLHLPTGDVHIKANNNSAENVYIQSMTVDGKDYTKCYITHSEFYFGKGNSV